MILAKDFLGIYRIQVLSAKSQIEQYSENLEIDQLVFVFTLSFVLVTIEINDLVLFHQIFILPSVFAMYGFFTFSDFGTTFIRKCEWNKKSQGLLTSLSP